MNSKKEEDTYRLAPWLVRQILTDLESGNVVRFPDSWLKKLRRSRSHIIVAIAGVILKLNEENADGTVMLPRHLSERRRPAQQQCCREIANCWHTASNSTCLTMVSAHNQNGDGRSASLGGRILR